MVDQKCPLCGCRSGRAMFEERGYTLTACDECDLCYIRPYPAENQDVHKSVVANEYEDLVIVDAERFYLSQVEHFKEIGPTLQQECRDARSVLDVGCGCGRLLELLGARPNVRRVGVELNRARAAVARRITGCEIHEVPVEQFTSDQPFDAIIMVDVLSHIPWFDSLFGALRRLLAPGGKFILKVGEITPETPKNALFDWEFPGHLHFPGMRTLDFMARKYGMEITRHDRIPGHQELFSPVRWKMCGRSRLRNAIKTVVVHTPLALRMLERIYVAKYGETMYSSLVVMKVAAEG